MTTYTVLASSAFNVIRETFTDAEDAAKAAYYWSWDRSSILTDERGRIVLAVAAGDSYQPAPTEEERQAIHAAHYRHYWQNDRSKPQPLTQTRTPTTCRCGHPAKATDTTCRACNQYL